MRYCFGVDEIFLFSDFSAMFEICYTFAIIRLGLRPIILIFYFYFFTFFWVNWGLLYLYKQYGEDIMEVWVLE